MKGVSATMLGLALGATAALGVAGTAAAQQKGEILIGEQCDRTGPTQIVGIRLCAAIQDYINLVNSQGGVEGYKIKADEIDHEYKVPPGMEGYERDKRDGAVSYMIYGTPHAQALNQKLTEDKIPGTSPGLGRRRALPLPVSGSGDLLVARRRGDPVHQGQAGRRSQGQEDRLRLLRQPGGTRGDPDHRGSAEDRRI
jgi:hypothetical protein